MQNTKLQAYFPMLKNRREILATIHKSELLTRMFNSWETKYQNEFLDFCSGARGVKMLYDTFAKELLNPKLYPERLGEIISLLLGTEVTIIDVLPNEGTRVAAENSLLTMDIVVQLADGSIANVEIQKIGYAFPGQRCACYSADLLLRQYKMVREKRGKKFNYRDVKNVYTIIFLEKSGDVFLEYPENYLHYFEQSSDTGLEMELLQKYVFIPIDIFLKTMENRDISNRLEAWLTFLGSDAPKDIVRLIEGYPDFKAMYAQIYEICRNVENAMGLFSEELAILDRNTVKYMMDEMQEEIDRRRVELAQYQEQVDQQKEKLNRQKEELDQQKEELDQQKEQLDQQQAVILEKEDMLAKMQAEKEHILAEQQEALIRIAQLEAQLTASKS